MCGIQRQMPGMAGADGAGVQAYRELMADVFELAGRSRRTSDGIARRLGQSAARWHVLSVVTDEAMTVPRIAERLGVTRQSVQRVVDELVADALVALAENPGHRRSSLVQVTGRGKAVAEELFTSSAPARARMLERAGVSLEELRQARTTLRRLLEHFDDDV